VSCLTDALPRLDTRGLLLSFTPLAGHRSGLRLDAVRRGLSGTPPFGLGVPPSPCLPRTCRVGGGAPEGAGLRPPLKRHVRVSRMPLSRRHRLEMRAEGNRGVDPRRTRQVAPDPQSPRTVMYGVFAESELLHLIALPHLGFRLVLPVFARRLPRPPRVAACAVTWLSPRFR